MILLKRALLTAAGFVVALASLTLLASASLVAMTVVAIVALVAGFAAALAAIAAPKLRTIEIR